MFETQFFFLIPWNLGKFTTISISKDYLPQRKQSKQSGDFQ